MDPCGVLGTIGSVAITGAVPPMFAGMSNGRDCCCMPRPEGPTFLRMVFSVTPSAMQFPGYSVPALSAARWCAAAWPEHADGQDATRSAWPERSSHHRDSAAGAAAPSARSNQKGWLSGVSYSFRSRRTRPRRPGHCRCAWEDPPRRERGVPPQIARHSAR